MAETTQAKPAGPKKKRSQGIEDLDEGQTLITQLRILLPNADGGAVIGKGGENVKHLRYKYHAKVAVADCSTPERILKVEAMIAVVRAVVLDIMRFINAGDDERRLKVLIHDSQAGAVIGKSGSRIKQLKEKCNTYIRVFPRCAPNSTERVYEVIGKPQDIALSVFSISELLYPIQPLGVMMYYDPENYTECLIEEYGGYRFEEGFPKGYIGRNSLKAAYAVKSGFAGQVAPSDSAGGGQKPGCGSQMVVPEGGDLGEKGVEKEADKVDDKPAKRKRGCRAGKHKRNRVCAAAVRENKVAAAAAVERHGSEPGTSANAAGDVENKYKPPQRPFGTMAHSYPRPSFPRPLLRGPPGPGFGRGIGGGMMPPPAMMAPPLNMPPHQPPPPFPAYHNHPPRGIPILRHANSGLGGHDDDYNNNKGAHNAYNHQSNFYPAPNNDNNNHHNYQHNYNNYNANNTNNHYYQAETTTSNYAADASYPATEGGFSGSKIETLDKKTEFLQVSLPVEAIASITGGNGMRLKQVMQETGCEIKIEPPSSYLPNQFIVSLRGNPDQIKNSQYLLQMCVVRYSGKSY